MLPPSHDYHRLEFRPPPRPFRGLDALVNGFIGSYQRRAKVLESLKDEASAIDALAPEYVELSDHELQSRLLEFRSLFRRGGKAAAQQLLPALAAIREAADRQLGLRPFPVQLMGALALHRGFLAEMATGEGKTLTASIAAILAGWTGRPCHVITVNDYLVQRDAEWLEPLYHFCGVRVGFVAFWMGQPERAKNYGCDVTYVTSKELLADFLRDRLIVGKMANPTRRLIRQMLAPQAVETGLVLRGLHTAIVDEADSVLIDEAVTPLIIAAPHKNDSLCEAARLAHEIVEDLQPNTDYRSNARYREIDLTEGGFGKMVQRAARLPGLWQGHDRRLELVVQALVAREFFQRDKQYIVEGGKVVIVDEFTGRPMPQRTWREGMHQAIEAKEGLPISDPTETVARLSFQRFFRCFQRLSGMTGTAREAAGEFWQTYGSAGDFHPSESPLHPAPITRSIFLDDVTKWHTVVDEIERIHATGRPLLVGTRSVFASERLAATMLTERGMDAKVLNATHLADESAIIALAGERGRITIATNMAGRGTDIKLAQGVAALGGLHVIATERHESGRVDRQLFGRSGRQGDPGSAQAFVSAEDELIRRHLPAPARKVLTGALRGRLSRPVNGSPNPPSNWPNAGRKRWPISSAREILASDLFIDEALSFASPDPVG